jgi:hypothetical protein
MATRTEAAKNQEIPRLQCPPYLECGGIRLYGDEIINHHRTWMTSSYHCIICGAQIPGKYPCRCGFNGKFHEI